MKIKINDFQVAIGLDWHIESNSKGVSATLKQQKGLMYVRKKQPLGRFLLGIGSKISKENAPIYAGALLVAKDFPECLICQSIGNDKTWFCSIKDGVPLPGYDIVIPNNEVRSKISETMMHHPDAVMVGDTAGAQASLIDIVGRYNKKSIAFAALKDPAKANRDAIMLVAAFLLAGYGTSVLYSQYQKANAEAMTAVSEEMAQMAEFDQKKMEAALQEKLRGEFNTTVTQARADMKKFTPPAEQFKVWADAALALPLQKQGYNLESVSCLPAECLVVWRAASAWSNPEEFLGQPGMTAGVKTVTSDPQPAAGTVTLAAFTETLPLVAVSPSELPASTNHQRDIMLAQTSFDRHSAAANALGGTVLTVSKTTEPVIVEPPQGLKDTASKKVGEGTIIRLAANRSSAKIIPEIIDLMGLNFSLDAISFSGFRTGQPLINVAGKYQTPAM